MISSLSLATTGGETGIEDPNKGGLLLSQFTKFLNEIMNQPVWRKAADREMDYVDGNQLDADVLQRQKSIGMAPAIEPLIGPAVDSVLGFEAKTRKDWRITSDTEGPEGEAVAAAINYKLNQAERHSGADRACADAFKPQLCVGVGWVEVSRESDPFKFPIRCKAIHRNEIYWDFLAKEPDLSDARYLIRRKWTDLELAILKFPGQKALIETAGGDARWTDNFQLTIDGSSTTNLAANAIDERGWSIEEQEWRDSENQRVCIFEVWYRRWVEMIVLKAPDGRVVEFDRANPMHVLAVSRGLIKPQRTIVSKVFCSYWMGPHKIHDGPSPYPHGFFPYVPFWGKREDRTGVPYGVVRGMIFLQDNVNSALSKIRWGLSSVRVIRTKGAYTGTDAQLRAQIARVDADVVLDATEMAKKGAKFEVTRDFELTDQQYKTMQDSRTGIARSSGITSSFEGQQGTANSGVQEHTQIEQTTQALASLMDNFGYGRTMVGELIVSLLIEDMGNAPQTVQIKGTPPIADRVVQLNQPMTDPATGAQYCTNDVQRTQLKVALEDVPATSSFRAQQLAAMSEAFKAMPQNIQVAVLPHLLSLMDVPNKDEVIKAVQAAQQNLTEDDVKARIQQALKDAQYDLKNRELAHKYDPQLTAAQLSKIYAEINDINADAGKKFMDLMFAGMQAAEVVTAVPAVAGVADVLVQKAGGVPGSQPIPAGAPGAGLSIEAVKNKRTGIGFTPGGGQQAVGPAPGDTSPLTPATPASPFVGPNHGMTTMRPDSTGAQA